MGSAVHRGSGGVVEGGGAEDGAEAARGQGIRGVLGWRNRGGVGGVSGGEGVGVFAVTVTWFTYLKHLVRRGLYMGYLHSCRLQLFYKAGGGGVFKLVSTLLCCQGWLQCPRLAGH